MVDRTYIVSGPQRGFIPGSGKRPRKGRAQANGSLKGDKRAAWVRFPPSLFKQIRDEAVLRQVSFTAVVVELCEASIEGIE